MTPAPGRRPSSSRSIGLLADVSRARNVVAPLWPLTAFVAVNPLGGFQQLPFDGATAEARRWLGARTHLTLAEFRAQHARGRTTDADLRRAIVESDPSLVSGPTVQVDGRSVTTVDLVRLDLLHGPEATAPEPCRTAAQRLDPPLTDDNRRSIDGFVAAWCSVYVDEAVAPWRVPERDSGLYGSWRRLAPHDRRLTRLAGREGRAWIAGLPERPEDALDDALQVLGVDDEHRVDELRAQLSRLPGWAGYAHWYDQWAPQGHPGVAFRTVELLALSVTIEAAVVVGGHGRDPAPKVDAPAPAPSLLDARVAAVLEALATAADPLVTAAVRSALERFPGESRPAVWLVAQEHNFRDRLLTKMSRLDPGAPTQRPAAQAVFCIDVRSEGIRRHLESLGAYETLGFAGFFGVPIRWRPFGSSVAEARAPVLVTPRHEVPERPRPDATDTSSYLTRRRAANGAIDAFHAAKGGPGSPFALAEVAGWIAGPRAALRTLGPALRLPAGLRSLSARRPATVAAVDADSDGASGFSLQERTLFAEAILRTMGLSRRFAPLVVLCGHGSRTVNNPHASSLDCGACGGAPGGASARVAAAILNDPQVRGALEERGLSLADDTWFVAAEHDTASDTITVLDRDLVPDDHQLGLRELEQHLALAGERQAEERARRLPGNRSKVRRRGADWAQVRPEWGLAGNAAFVIGPRSITSELDLAGRVFLHSYAPDEDHDGTALETILTAPLVVGQWISAQYYFSTVDPDVFGAGDKTLHNPLGGVGVVLGEGGDLQVGLPLQSVAVGDRRMHEPLRLLAVVQAPLERTEAIIGRNGVLRELIGGGWINVAGRSRGDERWSIRSPAGTWSTWSPAHGDLDPTDVSLEVL